MPTPAKSGDNVPAVDPVEDAIRTSVASLHESGVDDEPELDVEPTVEPVVETVEPPVVVEPVVEPPAGTEPPVAEKPKPGESEKPVVKPVASADDELDITKVAARGANGRVNTIPHPRVVKMVEKSVERAKTEWTEKTLKPVQDKVTTYETRLRGIEQTEDLMFGTRGGKALPPAEALAAKKTFLSQLAASIPGYDELLRGTAAVDGIVKPAAADNADDPEPRPDVLDENQKPVGWTEAGLARVRAWDRRQATNAAVEATVAKLTKEYGLDRMSGAFKEVENKRTAVTTLNTELDAATSWPGFNDNAPAILAALEADKTGERNPQVLLRNAYNTVIYGLANSKATDAKTLEEQLRTRIAAELERAPRSTSTTTSSVSTRAAQDTEKTGDEVEDAIRASIRGLR